MSPEQTKTSTRGREAAEARYVAALQALALCEAQFLALDQLGAGAAAKLEALNARERAATVAEQAKRSVINAAWADGTLSQTLDLGHYVPAMLAEIARRAQAVA